LIAFHLIFDLRRYVAWLVNPIEDANEKASLATVLMHLPAIEEEEKEQKVNQEVLEIICSLPLPRDMALQIISKYISNRAIAESQVSFLLRFACFGKSAQETDIPSAISQSLGLFLVEKIVKNCKLVKSQNMILSWMGKLEKSTETTQHRQDVEKRIADIKRDL